ncbi:MULTISPECIES: hypothetical protein [Amycolatopsis]|uniref:Uncharacterized protein n=1 Tax=Amycolatopsis dendrobii TaxID=2760662 RepID=A0A7W3VVT2_9PSEU|nr:MULTISPECIES: hypothetical protein [Amycolatopsis]MBB1154060.1 hypothetical protein [Amycolatopsis dendrobii]UKD51561.1 hypothetical protein L3Q65_26910 [Amycolatopsis sp. FU40]
MCGNIVRDDDPNDSMYFLTNAEFDVEASGVELFGEAALVVRCPECERLWFGAEDGVLTEYVKGVAIRPEQPTV